MAEHVIKITSEAPDMSDSEVSSLCGSELELEMAWGEGPIAPLRTEASADDGAAKKNLIAGVERSGSNGNGSSRARTPQKRGNESPLARSKRLINIHPIRSAGYLSKPNELPVGVRKQQRWFNDHHFGNRAASTRLEDLMEHMDISVEWRSNFQKLAEPQNEDLQIEFRKGGGARVNNRPHAPRNRRTDEWNDAEQMFTRVDRRARTLMLRSFSSFALFIEAVEYVVLYFIQWREVPSELEIATPLFRMLKHPIELMKANEKDVRLILPLLDSAFHRLIIHSVCQFYGVRSRTEANRRLNTKIMVLKSPKRKFLADDAAQISLCEFIRETRIAQRHVVVSSPEKVVANCHAFELQSKGSESSEGFLMVEAPQV
ncbi:uncharacterized protein PITG_02732 [Phytophthora infestans T30-4]|uniref:R3H domain-containing protein n=1 Tax=Phytophthora infestans (strain T30-4) TaxID=403677 RepID=D0MX30_PHYIT|nr:uncharacterized protein PITG_02732 [Phytophthora infestans T30-4]EEY64193.1 conserved hypothetical protein [Phytophthora infestans T30-4]|eukprot:XP_002907629.1 conserved hypothetical protein [Phytophthora infestans T30-4]